MFNILLQKQIWQCNAQVKNYWEATQSSTIFFVRYMWAFHRKNRSWTLARAVFLKLLGSEMNWIRNEQFMNTTQLDRHLFPVKMISEQMAQIKPMDLLNSPQIPIIGGIMITEFVWGQHTAFLSPGPLTFPLGYCLSSQFQGCICFFRWDLQQQWRNAVRTWGVIEVISRPHDTIVTSPHHAHNCLCHTGTLALSLSWWESPMKSWWSLALLSRASGRACLIHFTGTTLI